MPSESSSNRWVFREGRRVDSGSTVRSDLAASLAALRPTNEAILSALIQAGEFEAALSDRGARDAELAAQVTDALAAGLLEPAAARHLDQLTAIVDKIEVPDRIALSVPEGFAYYALHPAAYAERVMEMRLRAPQAAVIGIRSIGTTLAAIVAAALARNGVPADRITVRPEGHPYDRKTSFTSAQLRWIASHRHFEAEFLVVDEGPGLSGTSFLSVGEALLAAGVERRRIHFVCSREVDPETLTAQGGPDRWRGFQTTCVRPHRPAAEQLVDISAGAWREGMCGQEWPASWTTMERSKFLAADRQRLYKFAGLGRFGKVVEERARVLADAGFGPRCFGVHDGFAEYEMLSGRTARRADLSGPLLERIADYCAWRSTEFKVRGDGESQLEAMARYNYEQEFGTPAPTWLQLESSTSVICDGRMLPHEWIIDGDSVARKTDGETHGDDHFFPGPTDIAWDLAGAIVEWGMEQDAQEMLLRRYMSLSGDDAKQRIDSYLLAYATFRLAISRMSAFALSGSPEQCLLMTDAERYRAFIEKKLRHGTVEMRSLSAAD